MIDWIGVTVPAVATLTYVVLLGLVLSSRTRSRATRAFGLFLLAFVVWTSGSFVWHLTGRLFWIEVLLSGGILGVLAYVYFIHVFLGIQSRLFVYILLFMTIGFLVSIWRGLIIADSYMEQGMAHMRMGPMFGPLMAVWFATYAWSLTELIRHYRRRRDVQLRYSIQYVAVGLCIWWLGIFTNAIPSIGNLPIDVGLGIITAGFIAYAILRHQLLDITVVIRRGLAYSILTAGIVVAYLLSVFVLERVLRQLFGANAYLSAFVAAVGFALLYDPWRRRLQTWVDRRFFRERADMQRLLAEVSQNAASIVGLRDLGPMVLDRIVASLAVSRAVLFVANKPDAALETVAQCGFETPPTVSFVADNPLVAVLRAARVAIYRDALLSAPAGLALWYREKADVEGLGLDLFVPIILKGELVGILALGPKLSEAPYLQEETVALETLSNQVAVAIVNARLVTDLQLSLSDLKQMQSQLIEVAKLSAVGQLVAGVAHELNNPLTTIRGFAELLAARDLPPDVKADLLRIDAAADRSSRIVRNLLTFARRHGSEVGLCDVNEILESTLSLQEYRFRVDGIEVVKDLQRDLPKTMADANQLQQVFLNIIVNAYQAMCAGRKGTLSVTTKREGDTIHVLIGDTGPGMSPEVLARAFEPFFSTKGVGEGTGLGLSICYGIVREHEGQIALHSKPGEGTTVAIELPLRLEPVPRSGPRWTEPPGSHKGRRVLVVDDEDSLCELVRRVLVEDGLVVDVAATGLAALELLDRDTGAPYDLILCDIKMPDMDGPQLYAFLHHNHSGMEKRLVFMTGDTSSPTTGDFLKSAKAAYIAKPFELMALRDIVSRSLKSLSR